MAKHTEFVFERICDLQYVNLILLLLYSLSKIVTLWIRYLRNHEHNRRSAESDSADNLDIDFE